MLSDAWDKVAGWGLETIQNCTCSTRDNKDAQPQGNAENWLVRAKVEVDGKKTQQKMLALKEERDELAKARKTRQLEVASVGEQLSAARASGVAIRGGDELSAADHAAEMQRLQQRLGEIRTATEKDEPRFTYLQGKLKNSANTQPCRFRNSAQPAQDGPTDDVQSNIRNPLAGGHSERLAAFGELKRAFKGRPSSTEGYFRGGAPSQGGSSKGRMQGSFKERAPSDDSFKSRPSSTEGPLHLHQSAETSG
ncbi:hypothetical protein T484DRAFT_1759761 [Baffinella frigidus]|nr:hypothetical protein T484DRAFT_1759761 [Cryptophyta sp. CCMP2293]